MADDPVRVGALGASSIGRRRMLPAVRDCPGAVVAAVASRDPGRAAGVGAEFGCRSFTDYGRLLDSAEVDAVYISLPNALHHRWAKAALESGKHVLVEKPATTNAADTAGLVALAVARGLVLRENFAFTGHSRHRAVRDLVDSGRLGEPRHFTASFGIPGLPPSDIRYRPELGGGALLDLCGYPVRAAQHFFGDELTVAGAALRESGVDVAGSAVLVSPDGVLVTAQFGFEHSYASEYAVWGSRAKLVVDRAFTPPPTWAPTLRLEEQDHVEQFVLPADDQYRNAVEAFTADVRSARLTGVDPSGERTARTMSATASLLDGIRAAARRV